MTVTIYTIGHSSFPFEKFLDLLKKNNIKVLVDVRSAPFSKYASQFNISNIKKAVEKVGIEYMFMEEERVGNVLGGMPNDVECYSGEKKIIYSNVIEKKWYKEGISKLIEIASTKKTAIMCSEEDPSKCHRNSLIAQSLLSKGAKVFHIRHTGKIEEARKKALQSSLVLYG